MKILIQQRTDKPHSDGYVNFDHVEHIYAQFSNIVSARLQSGEIVKLHDGDSKRWFTWFNREMKYLEEHRTDGLHILDYKEYL